MPASNNKNFKLNSGISVDHIAVVVLCLQQDATCLRAVSICTKHFQEHQIYVVNCIPNDTSSYYTLREILDENDLHTVNYIRRRDKDPRTMLQYACSTKLAHYSQVLLVNPQKVHCLFTADYPCGDGSSSTRLSETTADMSTDPESSFSNHSLRSLLSLKRFGFHRSKTSRQVKDFSFQGGQSTPDLDLWERTTLLMHLRNELDCAAGSTTTNSKSFLLGHHHHHRDNVVILDKSCAESDCSLQHTIFQSLPEMTGTMGKVSMV